MENAELLKQTIESKDKKALNELFKKVPAIDLAEASGSLETEELIRIFREVEPSLSADYFTELGQEQKEALIKALTDKELVKLINSQAADDVTDAIVEMPANLASRVMKAADPDMREDLNELLHYKKDTAGSIMTTEYLEFRENEKVEDAVKTIREKGRDAETVYNLFRRYDLNAIAVLNEDKRLVGVITIDDALDVLTEEGSEDIARLSAMEPAEKPYLTLSVWGNAKRCIPWIVVLLILGTFTSMIISFFQDKLTGLAILAAFIPTLLDTGGNSGSQTTGLMVRGLALGEFNAKHAGKVIFKELRTGVLVGLCVATFAFVWFMIEQYAGIVSNSAFEGMNIWNGQCWTMEFFDSAAKVSGLVAISLFTAVTISKVIGAALPILASLLKLDPALLSGPLLTTVMDIISLVIYFLIAMAFFPQLA